MIAFLFFIVCIAHDPKASITIIQYLQGDCFNKQNPSKQDHQRKASLGQETYFFIDCKQVMHRFNSYRKNLTIDYLFCGFPILKFSNFLGLLPSLSSSRELNCGSPEITEPGAQIEPVLEESLIYYSFSVERALIRHTEADLLLQVVYTPSFTRHIYQHYLLVFS